VIKSPFVALGYWRNGHIETGNIESDPDDPKARVFHTGDLVRQRADGLLEIIGRKDRQVKINGKRVEPAELELCLRRLTGILDAAIITVSEEDQQRLIAFIVEAPDATPLSNGIDPIRHYLRNQLPSSLHPSRLHRIKRIPRLPSGKQDQTALLSLDEELKAKEETQINNAHSFSREKDPIRSIIAKEWRNVLGKTSYRPDHTWDECGGDSLALIKLVFYSKRHWS